MLNWQVKFNWAICIAWCMAIGLCPLSVRAENGVSYEISDIDAALSDNSLVYTISGSSVPAYNVTERFSPFRVVLDVAGAYLADGLDSSAAMVPQNPFTSVTVSKPDGMIPAILRFEFTLADSHDYQVENINQQLQVKMFPAASKPEATATVMPGMRALTDFKITSTPNSTTISIVADGPIENYNVDTIGSGVNRPPRMYIDIDDVAINELMREKNIGTTVDKIRVAPRGKGARIVFDSRGDELFTYSVVPTATGLDVVIDESAMASLPAVVPAVDLAAATPASDSTLDELIDSSEKLMKQGSEAMATASPESAAEALANDFSFSGYKKQKISVDFYKIDIHNVFRLFRQITNLNIIVDEEVQGSLTLALNDVPWDFALDIILNLMDLKKEERFNTIVIYPSKKEFVWPTRAEDNLAFEADVEVIEQESLVIEKTAGQTKEIMQAKEFMAKAQVAEKRENFEQAADLFAQAWQLWPENVKISNRLATIYLVNLGMNARAVYYAKETLKRDPQNEQAALYAAIGSANMQRIGEAKEFFTQAISGQPPMKEAILSYAAFSENNGQNESALKLLNKFQQDYGETVDTMVAKARILDKLGKTAEASKQYMAILASGYQLRPDLKRYIEGRLAAKTIN